MARPRADRTTKTGRRRYTGRVFVPRHLRHRSNGRSYLWVGTHDTPALRDQAKADRLAELMRDPGEDMTVAEYHERYLVRYARVNRESSFNMVKSNLKAFVRDHGDRPLRSLVRWELEDWADTARRGWIVAASTMLGAAVKSGLMDRNLLLGLAGPCGSRADDAPPTEAEVEKLLKACAVLGPRYADIFRALFNFARFTSMRPGELFALRWTDINFKTMRIHVRKQIYENKEVDPKSVKGGDVIALTPPAKQAIIGLARTDAYVFHTKRGKRMNEDRLKDYWNKVLEKAELDFDFYLATRHYAAHYMWRVLKLPPEVVRVQMRHVDDRLLKKVYGHAHIGALDDIDAAFQQATVTPLRAIDGESA